MLHQQTTRRIVAIPGRETSEALEIGERHREDVEPPFPGSVVDPGREDLNRREAKRGERRGPLLDRSLQQPFQHVDGTRGREVLFARILEPLAT